ncbi:MAG: glycosyltransferase [Bdellovibrio sp.]|nr:glycosyltransferase [Bdellovibrio sp.]
MRGKNILYVWQNSYPWEIRVDKTITTLLEAGANVHLLCRQKKAEPNHPHLLYHDLSDRKLNYAIPFSPVWEKKIQELVGLHKIHLIIARDILIAPAAIRAVNEFKIPVILDMAEHYPAAMRGWKKYNKNFFLKSFIHTFRVPDRVEKYAVKNSSGVMTVCYEQELRLLNFGVKKENLCSIYNTPNLDYFPAGLVKPPTEITVFAHHGFMTPERGLDVAIRAFSILKNQGHPFRLRLAGAGECEVELKQLATNLDAPVEFTGPYLFSEFPAMISAIDIGILPYQLTEFLDHTVANKLFDYMAVGKPVLVSDTKALRRIVEQTGAGKVIDIRSPERIAASILEFVRTYSGEEGVRGRQAVEQKYNWGHDQKNMLAFLQGFL